MTTPPPLATASDLPARLLARVHESLLATPGPVDAERVRAIAHAEGQFIDRAHLLSLTEQIRDHVHGLGPLQPLVAEDVTDILVNADGSVWIEDADGLHPTALRLSVDDARALATRLAALGGRRLDDAMPWADAQLPGGLRFHALLPPLSGGGTVISLRRAATRTLSLDDLEASGTLSQSAREIVEQVVRSRLAFLISGGTGTGKTTLLSAMLSAAAPTERLVIVEDATELNPRHPHVVRLQARHANAEGSGEVSLGTLVRQCLRMRPDRIIVGECRGDDVRELLQALNTGHQGGGGTLHANTAGDVPARLEALGALAHLDAPALAAQALSAIDVILHMDRHGTERHLSTLAVLTRGADGRLGAQSVAMFPAGGRARLLPAYAQLESRLTHEATP